MNRRNLCIIINAILLMLYFDSLGQISSGSFTATCTNAGTVSWTAGPNTTLIFAKAGSAVDEGTPSDNINGYTANAAFGSGTAYQNDADAFCVFKNNSGTSFTLTGLTPGITYHFLAFTANGTNYSASHTFSSTTLSTPPNVTGEDATPGNGQANLSWTNPGCMDQILIVAKEGSSINGVPTGDGTAYNADSDFTGGGTTFDGTGKVVYKNNTSSTTVTGLAGGSTYYFRIFTRKGTTWSAGVETSVTLPLSNVTGAIFQATCTNTGTVSWTNPFNTFRILVFAKASSSITVNTPTEDESTFYTTASATFGNGDAYENDPDAFLIYTGTGTSVALTGLTAGTTYHFLILNANGTDYSSGATFSNSTLSAVPNASGLNTSSAATSILVSWTNPSCFDEIMVVAKPTSSIGASPSGDGSAYTANANFGGGGTSFDGTGKVVFKGGGTSVNVTGLSSNTQYFFKVFTRLGSSWSAGDEVNAATLCVPVNVTGLGITDGLTTANLNWTNPSCFDEIMIVAKQGSRTTASSFTAAVPSGTSYVANADFTSGSSSVFDGGKVVYKNNGTSASVNTLQTGTIYTFKVFTRKGDEWSNGTVIETVPGPPIAISSDPADAATGVSTGGPFVITFNENVFISSSSGQNNIVFNPNSGSSTSIAKGSLDITINGKVVTITPSSALLASKIYQVQIGNTVFSDGTNNFGGQSSDAWAAGSAVNIWDFTTELGLTPNNPSAGVCDGQFAIVPPIILQEVGTGNFPGSPNLVFTVTLGFDVSPGFIFDPGANVQITVANSLDQIAQGDLASATVGSITYTQLPIIFTFKNGLNNNAVRARLDKVTISGIRISSDGTGSTPAHIVVKSITNGVAIAGIENNVTPLATIDAAEAPIAAFDPNTRTSFIVNEDRYLLNGTSTEADGVTPSIGTDVFSGTGVTQYGDGKYYFHPSAAGVQTNIPITLTHTNTATGCSSTATIQVNVSSESPVLNLKAQYCSNEPIDNSPSGILAPNPAVIDMVNYRYMKFLDNNRVIKEGPLLELTPSPSGTYRLNPQVAASSIDPTSETFYIGVYGYGCRIEFCGPFCWFFVCDDNTLLSIAEVKVNRPGVKPTITSISPFQEVCQTENPIVLQSSTDADGYTSLSYKAYFNGFEITSPNPITEPNPGVFQYDPGAIAYPGNESYKTIELRYDYLDKNGCAGQVSTSFYNDRIPNKPEGLDATYCQFTQDPLLLTANGEFGNLRWYENQDLSGTIKGFGNTINTGESSLSPLAKTFYVVDASFFLPTCISEVESVQLIVTPVPEFILDIPNQCEGIEGTFSGPADANSYFWKLGEFDENGFELTSTEQNVNHAYSLAGVYNVSLTYSYENNNQVCEATKPAKINVGSNPIPNFTFSQLCDGDFSQFIGSSNIVVESYEWNFGDGNILQKGPKDNSVNAHGGFTIHTYKDPHHKYVNANLPAAYDVTVTAYTNIGCSGSLTKTITIAPLLTVTSENTYSMNDLDDSKGFWTVEKIKGDNVLWEFAPPQTPLLNKTTSSWVTLASDEYLPQTEAALNSPCFNIENLNRPILSLDYVFNTEERADGVVLEYSINGGVTWVTLGDFDSGLNWFNSISFKSGKIGNSVTGWSGEKGFTLNDQNEVEWLVGRNSLDEIPVGNRNKVRFRMYFLSDGFEQFEGFAFNNLKIEERNRIMLVENFTNQSSSNPKYADNNSKYLALANDELVKIQYHIGYPGTDNIFNLNTADPSARAAFYGISNTLSLVPRVYFDGYSNGDLISTWSEPYSQKRTLKPSPIKLSLETLPAGPNELLVKLNYTPIEDIVQAPGKKLVAHIAAVEETIGVNKYVVRKLLPSAVGTTIALPLLVDDGEKTVTIGPWQAIIPGVNFANFHLVGFIQDENTKEVYQAVILKNPSNLPNGVVTATETTLNSQVKVYPNPSDSELTIILPEQMEPVPLKLIDSFGRDVHQSIFNKGEQNKVVNTKDLAAGVYIIQLETTQGLVRKKVMVVH